MFKKVILGVVAATFVGTAAAGEELSKKPDTAPVASGKLDVFGRPAVHLSGLEGFSPFEPLPQFWAKLHADKAPVYAATGTSARDVAGTDESPVRESGAQIVGEQNVERQSLERSGFPQYSN